MGTISEIAARIAAVISEASALPVYPIYSKKAESECCVFALSPSQGSGNGAVVKYDLNVKLSCLRYSDALDIIDSVSAALCTRGDTPPIWDDTNRITSVIPAAASESADHEFDTEFYQTERTFEVYAKGNGER
jgi:hypothetical protein